MTQTRRARTILVGIPLLAAALAWAPAGAEGPGTPDAGRRLASRAVGSDAFVDDLRALCDRIGGRATGSPWCRRAIEWTRWITGDRGAGR